MSKKSSWPWVMFGGLALVGLVGCGGKDDPMQATTVSNDDDGGTSTSGSPVTTTIDPSDTTLMTTATTTGGSESSGGGQDSGGTGMVFLLEPDGGCCSFLPCDLFEQDCPEGEKCMPWDEDGSGSWNTTRCSPIDDDPGQPGDECTVEGLATSGIDSCDLGVMCWSVDPKTNMGTCVAMCIGDESNPTCEDPSISCAIGNDDALALCLPNDCDPMLQDCPAGEACYPLGDTWTCAQDASGDTGVQGDPCDFFNVCDPGYFCLNISAADDCEGGAGCCTAVCDLTVPMGLAQCQGQACLPWYEEGAAPPGYENVGACALPA